ncbi:MAG: hypothetical protein J6K03_08935 [Oscillospiraceae bacterium]|nr:hypothetical protein [Oscillospiraceae bacterium]
MKKIILIILTMILCVSLLACEKDNENGGDLGQLGGFFDQQDGNNDAQQGGEESETQAPLVIRQGSGTGYINAARLHEIVQTVQLTTENWRDYIRVYSYSYDIVETEKNAFGEVVSTKTTTVTRCQIGADNTRYHSFEGVAIELKHKSTNEVISYKFDAGGHNLEEAIDLSQYECTRIQGILHFVDLPEEVIMEIDGDAQRYFDMGQVTIDGSTGEIMAWGMYPTNGIDPGTNAIGNGVYTISQVLEENS